MATIKAEVPHFESVALLLSTFFSRFPKGLISPTKKARICKPDLFFVRIKILS
jgi:hypothetical protein